MESACKKILSSSAAHMLSHPPAAQWQASSHSPLRMTQPSKTSYSNAVSHRTKSTPHQHSFKINNVSLNVSTGYIEKQKTYSIVNTISPDLDLSAGKISGSILKMAGLGIQEEIRNKYYPGSYADVLVTAGHNLSCNVVYHTICPQRTDQRSEKVLATLVERCLSKAQMMGVSSISFPAIGTGVLGFSKQEVAQIMMDTAVKFAHHSDELQMDIHYIIYPGDSETLKAFENKLKSLRGAASYPSSFNSFSFTEHESRTDHYDSRDAVKSAQEYIELTTACDEMLREALRWYNDMLTNKHGFSIHNNFIQHFGQEEMDELLNIQTKWGVFIKVFFQDGYAGVNLQVVSGDIRPAVLEVEAMCCQVQEDFAKEEERDMCLKTPISFSRKPLDANSAVYREKLKTFSGFQIVRVEKLENSSLRQLFDLKKKQLQVSTTPKLMYQRLPAQFCNLLSRVGFQREFAPPYEQKQGAGIYFSSSVKQAEKLWKGLADEEYMYFVEAVVLTGKSTVGSPDLIVPPEIHSGDPFSLYDSVTGGIDTHVIFNGHQALPEYLIICTQKNTLN
ncbi:protein mono-ADP-ribosyltransferase PARP9 isoform X2 [Esox lucius]|nr:protein mono-ADP-ribosyltransferase PARP9 isoform X2 [Esox lucius]